MKPFSYIFQGVSHSDVTRAYMEQAGMNSEQIESVRNQYLYDASQVQELRRAAYAAESDPLYMEAQFDSTPETEQAWRAKVEEVKARYPLFPELA